MEDEPAPEARATQGRRVGERRADGPMAMPAATAPGAEHVVERQSGPVERARQQGPAEQREQERLDADEVRRELQDPRPFRQRLANRAELVLLEIAQPAVDEPRRPARRPDGEVVPFDERRPQPA